MISPFLSDVWVLWWDGMCHGATKGVDLSICLFVTSYRLGVAALSRRLKVFCSVLLLSPKERVYRRRDV